MIKYHSVILKIIVIIAIIVFAFWLALYVPDNGYIRELVQKYGYFGILIAATISSFNIVVPIPIVSFMPLFTELGFSFWGVVIIIVFGTLIGDSAAYFLGYTGRTLINEKEIKILRKLEHFRGKYPWAPLPILFLFASFAPFPNEVLLIPLGFMRYKYLPILITLVFGSFVFNILFSFGFLQLFKIFS
ncbi:hypothetical protein ACFL3E_00070 [Patescibacteria group bacterium]